MSTERKPVQSKSLSALVVLSMLFAAFTAMALFSTSISTGFQVSSNGVRAQSSLVAPCGQVPVPLGSASTYAALAAAGITNTGPSALTGNLGVGPGSSITGFPPGTYTGTENVANAASAGAEANLTVAYNNASGRSNCAVSVSGNLGGQTLAPGLYKSTSTLAISSGDLTLSGGGNPNAVFIFQAASSLTVTSGRSVVLTNGTQAGNVFWQLGSSAALGTTAMMKGTIMAYASVTMDTGSHLLGRALARTGDVTLANSTIVVPTTTSASTYAVTFTEGGLTSGTTWSVTFNGVPASSGTLSIQFTVANGSYGYTVGAVTGFVPNPSSGSISVAGTAMGKTVAFTANGPETYEVTFTESGLVAGTSWSVTLAGSLKSSTTTTLVFTEASGTYPFAIAAMAGIQVNPSSGSITVSGAAVSKVVVFTAIAPPSYTITFTESGLIAGTSWSVTLAGIQKSSTTTTVVFTGVNGTETYTVGTSTGYTMSPSSGSLTVSGTASNRGIAFTAMGSGSGGGGGGGPSSGTPWWGWPIIGIALVGFGVAVVSGLMLRKRNTPSK
jgi:hypothetical protein